MAAFFGDEDIATVIHAQKIWDQIAGEFTDDFTAVWAKDGDLMLRDKECTVFEDRFETSRLVSLDLPREHAIVANRSRARVKTKDSPRGAISHHGVIEHAPCGRRGAETGFVIPKELTGLSGVGERSRPASVARGNDHGALAKHWFLAKNRLFINKRSPVRHAAPQVDVVKTRGADSAG